MKNFVLFFLMTCSLFAENPFMQMGREGKIGVQNAILAKVNGKTISVMDVKKKMDMVFHQTYPQLANNVQAKYQFYESGWRNVLSDMIDHELIISDALDKEIKLTDGEVREAMEERFGPNVMETLDNIGLTYDETWKMLKNELIVQRMSWWFIHSKAISAVTPQEIKQAYRLYLEKNPSYSEWKYRVISIRTDERNEALAEQIYEKLATSGQDPVALTDELKKFEESGVTISVSNEYMAKTQDLSDLHKATLSSLTPGTYSKPNRRADQKNIARIFYLVDRVNHEAPSFNDLAGKLRDELTQKAVANESKSYVTKLRRFYGFDSHSNLPEDLHPFSIQ